MFRWFSNSTFLICLLEPWRRQAFAILARPEQSRRLNVGLPTPVKSQKLDHKTLPRCSLPSMNSSHLRAISHCLHNSITKQAYRRSQLLLHWISHRMDLASTSLLGTTWSRPTTDASGQYQPTGNNQTPLAEDDLNSYCHR